MANDSRAEVRDIHRSVEPKGDIHRPKELAWRGKNIEPVATLKIGSLGFVLGDGYKAFTQKYRRGHTLLVFFREVWTGNDACSGTLPVGYAYTPLKWMIHSKWCPWHSMTVLNKSIPIHLEEITPAIPSDLPGIGG